MSGFRFSIVQSQSNAVPPLTLPMKTWQKRPEYSGIKCLRQTKNHDKIYFGKTHKRDSNDHSRLVKECTLHLAVKN